MTQPTISRHFGACKNMNLFGLRETAGKFLGVLLRRQHCPGCTDERRERLYPFDCENFLSTHFLVSSPEKATFASRFLLYHFFALLKVRSAEWYIYVQCALIPGGATQNSKCSPLPVPTEKKTPGCCPMRRSPLKTRMNTLSFWNFLISGEALCPPSKKTVKLYLNSLNSGWDTSTISVSGRDRVSLGGGCARKHYPPIPRRGRGASQFQKSKWNSHKNALNFKHPACQPLSRKIEVERKRGGMCSPLHVIPIS